MAGGAGGPMPDAATLAGAAPVAPPRGAPPADAAGAAAAGADLRTLLAMFAGGR
jgi:hypothetical protein